MMLLPRRLLDAYRRWRLVRGVELLYEIIDKVLPAATPVWILPADVLPGVTHAYGLPVRRPGVDRPYLAFEVADPDEPRHGQ